MNTRNPEKLNISFFFQSAKCILCHVVQNNVQKIKIEVVMGVKYSTTYITCKS